ncbi:MAG TPA: metallophosphoesterase [Methylomusa anaerophila]|uniref:Putative metallophosphoesterase n=1 Tax=Methylomusa anaerophila TaxID=1930071 RepID=A0A348AHC6_9FIRM|nr:metallophosphoesterase [Methylomusa anaerophila]BBB90474.1 putative metallophosphoesterase [Methylomusa anaerophila]HML89883.1 metallophosphoesterase [Methylomusa anaerophila]
MQQNPFLLSLLFILVIVPGVCWLGYRILAKWHPFYTMRPVRIFYWSVTGLSLAIILLSRRFRPAESLTGEFIRGLLYVSYTWIIGLLLLMALLFLLHITRDTAKRFCKAKAAAVNGNGYEGITRRQFIQGVAAAVPALPFTGSGFGIFNGDREIVLSRHEIHLPGLPPEFDRLKVAQVSDAHIGPFFGMSKLERVLAMVEGEKPDFLAITGDLVDDLDLLAPTMERLNRFHALLPHGIYYCWGNHEYFRDINRIRRAVAASPVTLIENDACKVLDGNRPLFLLGVDYPWARGGANQSIVRENYFAQAARKLPAAAFPVLLAHHPDFFDNAFAAGIPLSLSGHTHGGQIAVGGKSIFPVQYKYMRGMYRNGASYGYVNVGAGHWLPFRIGCPAEVAVFTLRSGDLGGKVGLKVDKECGSQVAGFHINSGIVPGGNSIADG